MSISACVCVNRVRSESVVLPACMYIHVRLLYMLQDSPNSNILSTPTKPDDIISLLSESECGTPQKPDVKRTKLSFGRVSCSNVCMCIHLLTDTFYSCSSARIPQKSLCCHLIANLDPPKSLW